MTSPDDHRLPRSVVPRRYELVLAPDLELASFSGSERVEIEVVEPVERIVMHAADLEIVGASLALGWASDGDDLATADSFSLGAELDDASETVAFLAPSEDVPPGRYTLSCSFRGVLNDKLHGFYRSTFDDEGTTRVLATTQFEQTDARRAFPCLDEPDRKAVFSVTIDAPAGAVALSNGRELSSEELADGRRRVRFADTIPMSTYLVAFVVGPLVATPAVDVDGVALRVVCAPGKEHLAGPALDAAAHALRYFAEYFAIPYPGDKVDLVAIPDFAAGAMENLGCVTFRESILLADPDDAARTELERLAEVVEHELAHMWFGDLVTMRWWNGIWLNEAFATFMALCCEDDYRPEWKVFTSFARSKGTALGIDGLHATRPVEFPVALPDEAAAMFDVLTYEKGASVLWMLEQYLGTELFRAGIRRYLAAHAQGSTETHDLWDAIEAEASGVPVRAVMEGWIFRGGYPLVSASSKVAPDGTEAVGLAQSPFTYLAHPPGGDGPSEVGSSWLVPVIARSGGGELARVLLGPDGAELPAGAAPVVVNAGGSGFYRVAYDAALRSALLSGYESLEPVERYGLVSDAWATFLAGRSSLREVSEVLSRVASETDPHVWSVVIGALGLLDLLAPEGRRAGLAEYSRGLLAPQLARVGWERAAGEDEMTRTLRAALVAALGTFGRDDAVARHCDALFAGDHGDGPPVPADIASAVLGVVADHGHASELDAILARYRSPRDPLDEDRHLGALGRVTDPDAARRVRELCLTEIRNQSAPHLLASLLSNRSSGPATWEFVRDHYEELVRRFPPHSIHRTVNGVVGLAQVGDDGRPLHADGIRSFLAGRFEGGHRRLVDQSLERLEVNVRLARRLPSELDELVLPG